MPQETTLDYLPAGYAAHVGGEAMRQRENLAKHELRRRRVNFAGRVCDSLTS